MCQFVHEGKQIKLLLLRPKTRQPKQISTLALLSAPLYPPLIANISSLSPISHAYHVHKLLPPLLSISSYYRAFKSATAFASHKNMHKLHKEIRDGKKTEQYEAYFAN